MTYELTPSDKDALSDYGALPNPIEGFTTQELIDELAKRDNVKRITIYDDESYAIAADCTPPGIEVRDVGKGEATILVVKK